MNYTDVKNKFEELFGYSLTDLSTGEIGDTEITQFFEAINQVDPRTDTSITLNMLDARMEIGDSYSTRFRANFEESPEAFVQALDNFVTELGSGTIDPQAGFHQFLEERVVLGVSELSGGREELNVEEKAEVLAERTFGIKEEAATISDIANAANRGNNQIESIIEEANLSAPQIAAISTNIKAASLSSPDTTWDNLRDSFSGVANLDQAPTAPRQPQTLGPTTPDTLPNADTTTQPTSTNWDDDSIMSTYEQLRTLNPESVTSASAIVQDAYSFVQPIRELEVEMAQYQINPATYIQQGKLPPSDNHLMQLEENAYNHLSSLPKESGLALQQEVSQIALSDVTQGITAPSVQEVGGQQYLQDSGINSSGTAPLPEAPVAPQVETLPDVDTAPAIAPLNASVKFNETPSLNIHTVEKGDSLWKMGRDHGLSNADIPNFVQHMTILNADQITDPDKIYPGQKFTMPSAEMLKVDASEYYEDKSASDIQQMRDDAHNANTPLQQNVGGGPLPEIKIAAGPSV